jgi:hypothetical protein
MAPAPEYEAVTINPISKNATLEWKTYPCANVQSFQVWRRISEYSYSQPECNTGMPHFLRYEMLAELPGNLDRYTDTNLSFGSQYCYRVVALVGADKTPGKISLDTCLIPKPAEAPLITNVSVNATDKVNGSITIRWTRPFDIDQQQYSPPYAYSVFRRLESEMDMPFDLITPEKISDTVFHDTGLNTLEQPFRYKVELYVPSLTAMPVDTSSAASSVYLSLQPLTNGIALSWTANTPWYNFVQAYPYHLIYRRTGLSGDFILIDSVDVNEHNLSYVDNGQFNNIALDNTTEYFYKVLTRGSYGNPAVVSPLENFSQVAGTRLLDTIPPCSPLLSIKKIDCSQFTCETDSYYTILEWDDTNEPCADDVIAYELYFNDADDGAFTSMGVFQGKTFTHTGLTSLDKCYRIQSIDFSGNRSDTTIAVCSSSCVNFKLPNVITPGYKDEKNDFLTVFPSSGGSEDCSRSVKNVDLTIYNRWGVEIFTSSVNPENSLLFWDGINNSGTDASAGTYFYSAMVTFETTDPEKKNQQIKGWIQLVR